MSQQFRRNVLLGLISLAVASSIYGLDIKTILEQPLQVATPNVVVITTVVSFPPGDEGSPPHFHSGPAIAYVLKGSLLFQVGNERPRIIPAGEAFYEEDRAIHMWFANASDNSTCEILGIIYGRPEEPLITYVQGQNRTSRADALLLAASQL